MIEIAKIVKPQGIKGEVKALPSTNVVEVFDALKECLVGENVMHIEHIILRQGFLYIKFKEINDRNRAEELRNKTIRIEKEFLAKFKKEDEFLVDDLIGMMLYDENGDLVGQVMDIVNYGASDICIIEVEKRLREVPFLPEVFVYKEGKLIVDRKKLFEVMV